MLPTYNLYTCKKQLIEIQIKINFNSVSNDQPFKSSFTKLRPSLHSYKMFLFFTTMKQTDKFLQKENLATCENLEIPPRVLENYKT